MNKYPRLPMLVAAACALLVLTACGNKGPLVMPQKPVPVEEEVVPAQDQPAIDQQPAQSTDEQPADADA
ncbi:MAG: lipoprotein [Stenotrophomonas sp.]